MVERWGQSRHINPRRRFYKILGKLPPPFGLVLEDYTNICNAVDVEFDYVDVGVFPARVLSRCKTGYGYDRVSREQYGSRAQTLWAGAVTPEDAMCLRDAYLKDYAQPHIQIDRHVSVS